MFKNRAKVKNADAITIGRSKYAAMAIGFTTKADANLNCTITLTGKATEATTLNILFSLDGVYYDLKPVQNAKCFKLTHIFDTIKRISCKA